MNKSATQTLDEMCFEKEAFLRRDEDYEYNRDAYKLGNKKMKNLRENLDDVMARMPESTLETAIAVRPNSANKATGVNKANLSKQIINAVKKHPYLSATGAVLATAAATDLASRKKRKSEEENAEKAASVILDEMCMEKDAALGATVAQFGKNLLNSGTVQKAIGAGKNLLNSNTAQKAIGAGKNFLKSDAGQSLMNSARQGATFGAISGALDPGTDENGNKKSRFGSAIKGIAAGTVAGMAADGIMRGGSAAWNTVKNAWPTKTASQLLDEMCLEKEAEWDPGIVMGGIMGGISGLTSAQKKGLNWKDTALKVGGRAATGAILGGTVNGVANYINNKSQAIPSQQDYQGKQNFNG